MYFICVAEICFCLLFCPVMTLQGYLATWPPGWEQLASGKPASPLRLQKFTCTPKVPLKQHMFWATWAAETSWEIGINVSYIWYVKLVSKQLLILHIQHLWSNIIVHFEFLLCCRSPPTTEGDIWLFSVKSSCSPVSKWVCLLFAAELVVCSGFVELKTAKNNSSCVPDR